MIFHVGEKLTRRLREKSFRAIIYQEISFFDKEENSTGALTAKLAEDATLVQGITGPFFGAMINALSGVIAGLIIAFLGSWQLTLVIIGLIPIMGAAGYLQLRSLAGFGAKTRKAYEEAGKTACEAIVSIRTVLTLTQERTMSKTFYKYCDEPHALTIRGARLSAAAFAFSQAVPFLSWGVSYYYGSRLVIAGTYSSKDIIQAMFAVIFTSMAAGEFMFLDQAKSATIPPTQPKLHLPRITLRGCWIVRPKSSLAPSRARGGILGKPRGLERLLMHISRTRLART